MMFESPYHGNEIMNVLESVLTIQRQRAEAAEQAFRELVTTLASNPKRPPKPEAIDEVLVASRHSVDDLAAAVKLVERREALRAEIRSIDARQDDRAGLLARIETANAELQAAQDRHRDATFPLQREVDEIDQMHHRRQAAERELRDLIDDDQADELAELEQAIREASNRSDNQTRLVRDLQTRLLSADSGVRELAVGQIERAEESLAAMMRESGDLVRRQSELLRAATLG